MDFTTRIERLKEEAAKRWGEEWTIEVMHWADGDSQSYAVHRHGRNEDGHIIEDTLFLSDTGETAVERATLESREVESEFIEPP